MSGPTRVHRIEVEIHAGGVALEGAVRVPGKPIGTVIFAHGSGSGRLSPRNNAVVDVLHDARLATLLADLLTEKEAQDRRRVFDIALLARRLIACTDLVEHLRQIDDLPVGYFGASTGAGAALLAAAGAGDRVRAIVSRGGRPDLAGDGLSRVRAPTLLIVGGLDHPVLDLNREALTRLTCDKELAIIPGSTHLFEEPGALDEVARLARDWFALHLPPRS